MTWSGCGDGKVIKCRQKRKFFAAAVKDVEGRNFIFPVNIAWNKLCPEQSHRELLSRASGVQSLYCKLLRALGDPSFICMTVFRIINFILYVLQLAELVAPPWLFLSSSFPSLLASSCFTADNLTQTQPPRFTVLELHLWLPFCSLLYPSITASLSHTLHTQTLSLSIFTLIQAPESPLLGSARSRSWSRYESEETPRKKVDCTHC